MQIKSFSTRSQFHDIYWSLFAKEPDILNLANTEFNIKTKSNSSKSAYLFEHIGQTGGASLSDLFIRSSKSGFFRIPSFEEIWLDERRARRVVLDNHHTVLSVHYLNGSQISPSSVKRLELAGAVNDSGNRRLSSEMKYVKSLIKCLKRVYNTNA